MNFAFNAEQTELKKGARRFLAGASSSARVREAMATESGFDSEVWRRIGAELGWMSLAIPEAYGGAGFGSVEVAAVMEEMGRALFCAPFFASACLAANALLIGGTEAQKQLHLPGIASGETIAALAITAVEATANSGDFVLSGTSSQVVDGHNAHLLIIAARFSGEDSPSLVVVRADSPGVESRFLPTMDKTRKQSEVVLRDVRVPASAVLGERGSGGRTLARTIDLASIALAAEQVGGAERCLEMALEYAKTRVQFGRAIGSFQAIKHKLADMFVLVECARSASYYAAWAASHAPEELAAAAALAKAYCSDAYFQCAAESIQIHGGIGFTWEHDAHLYFKRAKSTEVLLRTPAECREIVARQLDL